MASGKKVLAFDIYGTLLNTGAIAKAIHKYIKEIQSEGQAKSLATSWRTYQLEYTWRLNSMNIYESFDVVTRKSLLNAAADLRIPLTTPTVEALMQAYHELPSFEDASSSVKDLLSRSEIEVVLFSNGTEEMVTKSIMAASLPISLSRYLANSVKKYKPSPELYEALIHFLGMQDRKADVWLVSGNPFDVAGARSFGMNAIWVDRAQQGWNDRLLDVGPTKIVRGLGEITKLEL
ncbi:haloacid dehalogenase [Heliocybe sulcata]|uniref:Haloacid dehalogenase n=1 Tax=Heliocybe sulcata TaxID=5364 RepID=A0A5C3MPR2_9AGAM|nr:haloacid dehalogenase [Heliocybe sulcata]